MIMIRDCKQCLYCIINAISKACTNTEGTQAKGVSVPVIFWGGFLEGVSVRLRVIS